MTKAGVILSLLMVGFVAASSSSGKQRSGDYASGQPKAFRAGYEYVFDYNGQIAIGQIAPNQQSIELTQPKYAEEGEQKAATRIQCQSKFTFSSEHIATLRLDKCRIGQLNEPIIDAQRVQPMGMFQPKKMDDAKLRELQLPCDFRYVDGVVKTIQFHDDDKPWSKNIKRAVLNLIQMNLKQQNAIVSAEDNNEEIMNESEKFFTSKAFSVPETTLEGECLTTYTINSNSDIRYRRNQKNIDNDDDEQKNDNLFNVTKSIGFKQCKRIADITFGVQSQPEAHPECVQCMQEQWLDAKRQQQQRDPTDFYYRNPCEQKCDPKLVDEQQLDRSTVMRLVVAGRPESLKECAIQRAELLSQYVYKNPSFSSTKSSSIGGGALRAIVAAELRFSDAKPATTTTKVQLKDECVSSDEEDCSLLYDNTVETLEKRFQMFGDAEFDRAGNPFAHVHGKVDRVVNIYRRIVQSAADKTNGLESEAVALMPRLFKTLRMCTVAELEQIDEALRQQIGEEQSQLEKAKQLFADTLAIAGTRNAVAVLMKKIRSQKECSPIKAAQIVSSLTGLSSLSTAIVDLVVDVCKSDAAKKSAVLRQSCLLTSGALVGELCRFSAQKSSNGNAQRIVYGQQTGFNADDEMCPLNKKKAYKQFFVEKLENAETIYEQILALKAIGNAALDITVAQPLEAIIRGQQTRNGASSPLIRMQAIDALRRVAAQMPRKIQRLLLPIVQNVRERPEVRIIAFSTIMSATRPERPIIDQLVYTLAKEQNRDVQSYVYTMIKALAKSPIVDEQEIAKHLKAALKLANVDDRQMARAGVKSVHAQLPLFFGDDKYANKGLLVKLISVLNGPKSSSSQKPMEVGQLAASIHSIIDGQLYNGNGIGIAATFANADHWARNLLNAMLIQTTGRDSSKKTRSQRNGADSAKSADQELRDIASTLGVQKRKDESTYSSSEEEDRTKKMNGFAMLSLRVGNVDRAVIPFSADMLPASLKSLLNGSQGGKLSMAELRQLLESSELFGSFKDNSGSYNKHYRTLSALMLNGDERCIVPTTLGLPLKIAHSSPVVFGVDGQLKPAAGTQSLKAHFNVHATGCMFQSRTMNVALRALVACGVKSERAVEFHAPLNADVELNAKEGVKIALKTPTRGQTPLKTRLFGIHTLAATFTRDFDAKTHMFREPKLKSIHSAHYADSESDGSNAVVRHMDINHLFGEHFIGIPLRVNGHFYVPGAAVQRNTMDYLIALCQIFSTSENHVHITYEPTDDTPREIVLRAEASAFQKLSASSVSDMVKQLRDFYAEKSHRFQSASSMMGEKDNEDIYTDDYHKQNDKRFKEHLDQFSNADSTKKTFYKHSMKLSAQTMGGRKQARAELELHAACDAKHKLCKMTVAAKRSPMLADESEWWTLRSDAAAVMPDYVSTIEHLEDDAIGSRKNQKFMFHAKTEWGCSAQNKQSVEIRVEGQNKKDKQLQKLIAGIAAQQSSDDYEQQQSAIRLSQQLKRETAFLNYFALVADYKLQPHTKAIVNRAMEALKTYHFWSAAVSAPFKKQQSGRLYANMEIAALTQRYASLFISTPTEQVQIPSVVLPIRVRPMPLVQAVDASTHSFTQALSRWSPMSSGSGNAECRAYANRVSTFDGVEYTHPITTDCYTVLAKDCSEQAAVEQQPRFIVLMKSVSKDGKQKKIKVVTSSNIIECQAVYNTDDSNMSSMIASSDYSSSKRIQCTVNGEIVTLENSAEFFDGQQPLVEYNNGEMTSVVIQLAEAGARVRFGCLCAACDCQKAVVTYVDERYKRASCGLCGHYDDSTEGEWRSADDTPTDDLAAFHRSYAIRNAEECSAGKLDAFYTENKQKFRVLKQKKKVEDDDFPTKKGAKKAFQNDEDEDLLKDWQAGSYVDEDDKQEVVSSEELNDFYGSDYKNGGDYNKYSTMAAGESSEENDDDEGFFDFAGKKQQKQRANSKKVIEPESQTRVIEYNHLICFSVQPVKQCPSGTIAAYKPINQITQYDIETAAQEYDEAELDQQSTDEQPKTNVKFACLSRSLSTARRMQHQAKRGVIVDVSGYPPNSVESVVEPKSCIKISNSNNY